MNSQRIVRALLASPADAADERSILDNVVVELNTTWADFVGVRIDLIKWETHAWPAAGSDAQGVINSQLPDDYEIFVGIMASRLGTPTPRAPSGTVEEFERAFERRGRELGSPEIMFYFRKNGQEQEVLEFKKRLQALGVLYWSYEGGPPTTI